MTLTRGLGESLNRAHEALLNKYGFAAINSRAHALGLTHTNVYPGCQQPAGKKDWTHNRSTLGELGKLFENVDNKTYFNFVGGYFVDNFKAPCNEDTAAQSQNAACRNWKTQQNATYDLLMGEPYRLAIRKAIATW